MTLGKKQERFAQAVPLLMQFAQYHGYEIRIGDAFRDPRVHGKMGEKVAPYGHINSCHKLKLAIDLYLTKDGVYLEGVDAEMAHDFLHDYWDMLDGAERIPHDLNHYSFEHEGYR